MNTNRMLPIAAFALATAFSPCRASLIENFTNAPDYTNNWHLAWDVGGASITYTPGNLEMHGIRSNPYPPGSSVALESNEVFTGDIDVTFDFIHRGAGRTVVFLASGSTPADLLASAHLDTDDTNYLNFIVGSNSTDWKYSGSPYMNREVSMRIQTVGSQVNFFADGVLLQTYSFAVIPTTFEIGFAAGSVPWKSADNDTSFLGVRAFGRDANAPEPGSLLLAMAGALAVFVGKARSTRGR